MQAETGNISSSDPEAFASRLSGFLSGSLTIVVNNFPLAKIDGERRTFDIELKGFEESGLRLSDLVGSSKKGFLDSIKQSGGLAHTLNKDGWNLRVFDGSDPVLFLGRGVTSLTGFVWLNPLKLSKLLRFI
jgi:hypothetical protein